MKIMLRVFFVFLFLGLLIVRPTPSYAWHGHDYVGVRIGVWGGPGPYYYGDPYYPYYGDPYYYSPSVLVASSSYQPVLVNGTTYYVNNGVYYLYTQYGYQAVATPVGALPVTVTQAASVTAVPASNDDSITVNIPNDKGGYNAVLLKKSGNGFIGPQGEFYAEFPKVSQLEIMYGK